MPQSKYAYIGVDPGKVTAAVTWQSDRAVNMAAWEVSSPLDVCEAVRDALESNFEHGYRTILAVERYTQGHTVRSSQNDAIEVIGIMRWFSHIIPDVVLTINGASDASRVGNRADLTTVGWWRAADPDQHRNKATAQLALAVLQHEPQRWAEILGAGRIISR